MDDRLIVRSAGERSECQVADDEVPELLEELFGVRDALT
jgi:hypothetical protein